MEGVFRVRGLCQIQAFYAEYKIFWFAFLIGSLMLDTMKLLHSQAFANWFPPPYSNIYCGPEWPQNLHQCS